jgi:hypothetical protein
VKIDTILPVAGEMVRVAGVSKSVSSGSVRTVLDEARTTTGPPWGGSGSAILLERALNGWCEKRRGESGREVAERVTLEGGRDEALSLEDRSSKVSRRSG